ncbi:MAG: FAD-dependent oxidoreductase [Pseudomonadota bacterium]
MEKGFDLGQAIAEANRCLLCHDAPCSRGCPCGTDPAAFIRKLRFRNIKGAIRTIKRNNILGGACGVLCPSARLCEKECSAAGLDRPIRISRLQRFLVEHSWKIGFDAFEKQAPVKARVAVVGAGPAGISCAAGLAKAGFKATVFEEKAEAGGVLRYGVPAHRFSKDFLKRELHDLKVLGVKFRCSSPVRGKGAIARLLNRGYKAVFIATGLWQPVRLKGSDGKMKGVFDSVEFLEAINGSRLTKLRSAIKGKVVAVIGGGSVAIDCAESALLLGARDVYLVYRRSYSQMPAEENERIRTLGSGVHFLLLNQPAGYTVGKKGELSGVRLLRTRLGKMDASGRRRPELIPGSEWTLGAGAVIEAIGNQAFDGSPVLYPDVRVSKDRLIIADAKTGKTSAKAIFAGGDIVRGPGLVAEAVGDGKIAAAAIEEALS